MIWRFRGLFQTEQTDQFSGEFSKLGKFTFSAFIFLFHFIGRSGRRNPATVAGWWSWMLSDIVLESQEIQIRTMMGTLGKEPNAFWCFCFGALDIDRVSPKGISFAVWTWIPKVTSVLWSSALRWFWETRSVYHCGKHWWMSFQFLFSY